MKKEEIVNYIPLETERMILRQPMLDDVDMIQRAKEARADILREWMSWSNDHGMSRQGVVDYLESSAKSPVSIPLIGVDKMHGQFVIATGIDAEDKYFRLISTGYWVDAPYEGKGYAFEAMLALFNFLAQTVGAERVEMGFYEGNARSRKLMERLGLGYIRTDEKAHRCHLDGRMMDVIKYAKDF